MIESDSINIIGDKIYIYNRLESDSLSKNLERNHLQQKKYLDYLEKAIAGLSARFNIPSHVLSRNMLGGFIEKEILLAMDTKPSLQEIYRDIKLKSSHKVFREYFRNSAGKRRKIYHAILKLDQLMLLSLYVYIGTRVNKRYY